MAQPNFKHLEFLPLDEENLVVNEDPQSNIRSSSCLNLGFLAVNSAGRFTDIIKINQNTTTNYNTFLDFSYVLEAALCNLLLLSTISNPQNTQITEHYRKYMLTISSGKILPAFSYCQNLLYTNFKTWGGFYGSLQYYMNLREEYEEYYTPSEIAYYSSLGLINYSRGVVYNTFLSTNNRNYQLLNDLYGNLETAINTEDVSADLAIYNYAKEFIIGIPSIINIFRDLRFYETWLPRVCEWAKRNRGLTRQLVGLPKNNEERALNTIIKVLRVINELGLDSDRFVGMSAKLIRQTLNPSIRDLSEELISIRKTSTYIENSVATSEIELLVQDFHTTIPIVREAYDYGNTSNIILSGFCPPGGYSLVQTMLATCLLNRAYIVAYRAINDRGDMRDNPSFRRSIKLIGYAGILLVKTGLPHLQAFGVSLMRTFNVRINNIEPNNFLDIY